MSENAPNHQNFDTGRPALRAMLSMSVPIVVQGIVLFIAAGRWNWLRGWVLIGLRLFTMPFEVWILSHANPVLLRERFRKHKGTESFDHGILLLLVPILLAIYCVAGLDAARFEWSSLGVGTILPGIALHLLGAGLVLSVMAVNPYLEGSVRIQEERHHKAITVGPYRFVRHPMYVGSTIMIAGAPLILGSAWAYLPVGALALLYVFRTAMEDRVLQEKLPGYAAYCRQTRYRLLPGVW